MAAAGAEAGQAEALAGPAPRAPLAAACVVIEAGNVCGDGSVMRWMVEYEAGGRRLFQSATFEHYFPASV